MSEPWNMPAGVKRHPLPAEAKPTIVARVDLKDATAGMNKTEERRALDGLRVVAGGIPAHDAISSGSGFGMFRSSVSAAHC